MRAVDGAGYVDQGRIGLVGGDGGHRAVLRPRRPLARRPRHRDVAVTPVDDQPQVAAADPQHVVGVIAAADAAPQRAGAAPGDRYAPLEPAADRA